MSNHTIRKNGPHGLSLVMGLAVVMLIPGCVGFSVVKKGERQSVGGAMTVEAPRDWNSLTAPGLNYWTLDGAALQHIVFVRGVGDDEVPWPVQTDSEKAPKFRKGMSAIEIVELVQATMALEKFQKIKITRQRPQRFAGRPGFAFDISCTTEKGLALAGRAAGAVVDNKLYMILYRGAELHYFDKTLRDFEQIVASAKIEES